MGLHYGDQRGEGREESWKRESGGSNRPVIILRNVCELCGQSFDNQFVFYKHLREHYEPEFISIGYPTDIPEPEGDSEYAKEDDNDGFVNDNEQFEGEPTSIHFYTASFTFHVHPFQKYSLTTSTRVRT